MRASLMRLPAVVFGLLLLATPARAQEGPRGPDVSSPRATFDTFLSAMVDVKKGRDGRIEDAVACLDLTSVPALVRDAAGPKLARDLKNYLDRVEYVRIEDLPVEVGGTRWTYRRTAAGEVSLTLTDDGRWLFSTATIDSLPALLQSVRGRAVVEGIEAGGGIGGGLPGWIRQQVPPSLSGRMFVLENWQWLALLGLAFLGVLADWVIRGVLLLWLRRILARSQALRRSEIDADFVRPIGIFFMGLAWWMFLPLLDLPIRALAALKFASQFVMAGAGVWAAYRFVDLLAAHFGAVATKTDTKLDDVLIPMVRRALKIVVLAFGVLFIAQNLDIDVTSLLAGLGIGGIAFALAAKDTVENLFGSFTVLIDRPFHIGDWVVIDDLEGTVEEIGFRSTRIRTFYNSQITIPNARLVNSAVDNMGARRYRRVKCMISIQYDTPPERIEAFCEGMRELIRRHPYTRKDYYMVYFNEFAGSSLNVLLYAFHDAPDWATELRERHRLFVDIVRLAGRLGVEFAFPTQTIHVASVPPTLATRPDAPVEPAAAPGSPEDAIRLGRAEAEAIAREMGRGETQPPVDFGDPDRIRPGS